MTDKEFKEKAIIRAEQKKRERKIAIASGVSSLAVTALMITIGFSFAFSSANFAKGGNSAMNDAAPTDAGENVGYSDEIYDHEGEIVFEAPYVKTRDGIVNYLSSDKEKQASDLINSLVFTAGKENFDGSSAPSGDKNDDEASAVKAIIYEIHIGDKTFYFTADGLVVDGEENTIYEGKTQLDEFVKEITGEENL
ncbi:MAG: hypothetical protein IJ800_01145 [Clostridia bacterium]|nr:hypothetical protein [Clostridia bacterium]